MNSLLDERCMTVWRSPSGLRHVEGWYGESLCGKWIDRSTWTYIDLTSIRYLGRISQGNGHGFCKRCMNNYKDVKVNG